jgi:hypothetical protein
MDGSILKGKLREQWEALMDGNISEFDGKLEMMSDLLQDDENSMYDDDDYYTFFDN